MLGSWINSIQQFLHKDCMHVVTLRSSHVHRGSLDSVGPLQGFACLPTGPSVAVAVARLPTAIVSVAPPQAVVAVRKAAAFGGQPLLTAGAVAAAAGVAVKDLAEADADAAVTALQFHPHQLLSLLPWHLSFRQLALL